MARSPTALMSSAWITPGVEPGIAVSWTHVSLFRVAELAAHVGSCIHVSHVCFSLGSNFEAWKSPSAFILGAGEMNSGLTAVALTGVVVRKVIVLDEHECLSACMRACRCAVRFVSFLLLSCRCYAIGWGKEF